MSPPSSQSDNMVLLVEQEAFAAAFRELYASGMALIDAASDYFSGEGRQAAQSLGCEAAILYADEVKRLGFRLMQAGSWLLLERAMREQDISVEILACEKKKVVLDMDPSVRDHPLWSELPERFRSLSEDSWRFMKRARHMERHTRTDMPQPDSGSHAGGTPVSEQMLRLRNAFSSRQRP